MLVKIVLGSAVCLVAYVIAVEVVGGRIAAMLWQASKNVSPF